MLYVMYIMLCYAFQWCVTNLLICYYQVHSSTVNTPAMLRPTDGEAATRTQLQGIHCTENA